MGTSGSFPTPSGGSWGPVKNNISRFLGGGNTDTSGIVAGTISANGGLAFPSIGGAGGGGAGGRARGNGRSPVRTTVSRLGSFGAAVQAGGVAEALRRLGLDELRGRSAPEVIARIAEHLAGDAIGLQKELLSAALRDSILEAAAIENDLTFEGLDASLQAYLNREGIEGLVELFLTNYVFDLVWTLIEDHADRKAETNRAKDSLALAVQNACRGHVRFVITEYRENGRLAQLDWFGRDGQRVGREIAANLEARLTTGSGS